MLRSLTITLKIANALTMAALLLAVLLVIIDAKLGLNATWASELSQFLLGWLVMLGGAFAYLHHAHLGLDILVNTFDPPTKRASLLTGHVVILLFALLVLIYGGGKITFERYDMGQVLPAMGISKAWAYLALPVSGVFVSLTAVSHLLQKPSTTP